MYEVGTWYFYRNSSFEDFFFILNDQTTVAPQGANLLNFDVPVCTNNGQIFLIILQIGLLMPPAVRFLNVVQGKWNEK